ncbi:hypothetical protein BWI15_07350 [Kribbella sp. ALI-6-A]|uniref:hypothetical protein n=1 Tax=Kribbella sp. ALI-6-A TaxID=1933817 RepID=UPI00097BDF57|nr:hypothetical protein [Kribbella sp. ALI-6-A]ONI75642.1 hypothetical protein BWI15_07350 [Kribbella sp. ALI-6-A]
MRARRVLPAVLAVVALMLGAGCANGGGLRVEGAEPATSTSPAPSSTPSRKSIGPDQQDRRPTPVTVSLAQVRLKLLADRKLEPFFRTILDTCTVVERCMSRGPTVNVIRSAYPQIVVYIELDKSFNYGAVLMAAEPTGPRRIWGLRADQTKISASQHGDLVVESKEFALNDKACCPSVTRVQIFRWNGRQMNLVSSQDQKGD